MGCMALTKCVICATYEPRIPFHDMPTGDRHAIWRMGGSNNTSVPGGMGELRKLSVQGCENLVGEWLPASSANMYTT